MTKNRALAIFIALAIFLLLPGIGIRDEGLTVVGALMFCGFIMGCVCTAIWMHDDAIRVSYDDTENQVGDSR